MTEHGSGSRRPGLVLGLLGAAAAASALLAVPARAATFTVDTTADELDGETIVDTSLRDAINAANANGQDDIIDFSVTGTIALDTANTFARLPSITTNITIQGPGASDLTISGGGLRAMFFVDGGTVTIRDLTLADGRALGGNGASGTGGGGGAAGMGGAIFANSGVIIAQGVVFTDCSAVGGSGGNAASTSAGSGGGGIGSHAAGIDGGNGGPFGTPGGTGGSPGAAGGNGAGGGGGSYSYDGGSGGFGAGGGATGSDNTGGLIAGGSSSFGGGGGGGGDLPGGSGDNVAGLGGAFGGAGGNGVVNGFSYSGGGGGGGAGIGGALFIRAGSVTLHDCLFQANSAAGGAGGIHAINGVFDGQPGKGKGGAIFVHDGASVLCENVTFFGNTAADAAGVPGDNRNAYWMGIPSGPPRVSSIGPAGPSPTGTASVDFTVRFSEIVTGVDSTDFLLIRTGTVTGDISATVTEVNGLTYTVTVDGVSGDGTLRLDLVGDGSIQSLTGYVLIGDVLAGSVRFVGEECEIDTPPNVVSILRADLNPTIATSVDYLVTFDENVDGVNASDFVVATTHGAVASVAGVVRVDGDSFTVTVDGYPQECTLRLDLRDNDSIEDAAGNPLGGAGASDADSLGETYVISASAPPPYVMSIRRDDPPLLNAGPVGFTVEFSGAVLNVDVAANFALATTGTATGAVTTITGAGASWSVEVNGITGDGTIRLDLVDDGVTIVNGSGEQLGGVGQVNGDFSGGEVYTIDTTAPSVLLVECEGASPTGARAAVFTVIFSEDVENVDAPDFMTSGVAGVGVPVVEGAGDVYTVTIGNVSGNGTLHLEVLVSNIEDLAKNPLEAPYISSEGFDPPPYVESITESTDGDASPVIFTVTFSEEVVGVDRQANFRTTTTGSATCDDGLTLPPSVVPTTGWGAIVSGVDAGGGTGTLSLDVVDGDLIRDTSGNPLGGAGAGNGDFTDGAVHWVGPTALDPPYVVSIVRAEASPTGRAILSFTVTFNESLSGVDPTDFALTGGAMGSVSSVASTAVPGQYTVTVEGVTGDGELRLDVKDDNSIRRSNPSRLGGPLVGDGDYVSGEAYEVDTTPPAVLSVVPSPTPAGASYAAFTVTFSEAVSGVDVTDFAAAAGVVDATVSSVVRAGPAVYVATVAGLTGTGSVRLDVVDDDSIIDAVGNPLGGGLTGNGDFDAGVVKSYIVATEALGLAGGGGCGGTDGAGPAAGLSAFLAILIAVALARSRGRVRA